MLDLEKEQEYWEGVPDWWLKISEEEKPDAASLVSSHMGRKIRPIRLFILNQRLKRGRLADIIALHIIDPQ